MTLEGEGDNDDDTSGTANSSLIVPIRMNSRLGVSGKVGHATAVICPGRNVPHFALAAGRHVRIAGHNRNGLVSSLRTSS